MICDIFAVQRQMEQVIATRVSVSNDWSQHKYDTANFEHSEQFLLDRLFGSATRARRELTRMVLANLLVAILRKNTQGEAAGKMGCWKSEK